MLLQNYRNLTGKTRTEVARELNCSARTLQEYENKDLAPPEIIMGMSKLYDKPEMVFKYCKKVCPIGKCFSHSVQNNDLPMSTLKLIKEFNDVRPLIEKIIAISADGEITSDEVADFEKSFKEILELEKAIQNLKISVSKNINLENIVQQINE